MRAATRLFMTLLAVLSQGAFAVEPNTRSEHREDTNSVSAPAAPQRADDLYLFDISQASIAGQLISVFENNTPVIQYAYAERLGDGRGITAGRAGFTTATRDLLQVVEKYEALQPDNPLTKFLPRLRTLGNRWSGSMRGLDGLEQAWSIAAEDEKFRYAQDEVMANEYLLRARSYAQKLGISTYLGLLIILDTVIQHGYGSDKDSLSSIIRNTISKTGGRPKRGVGEHQWLKEFLACRRMVLQNPHNRATRSEWAESIPRVDSLDKLLNEGVWSLNKPVVVSTWGTSYTLRPGAESGFEN